jgi:Kdo2-lipid IVA lauroyltransferase/acyltransferase
MVRRGAPASPPSGDRSIKRSPLRNYAEYVLAGVALKSLEWAPLMVARLLARAYVQLMSSALPRLSRVARRNLSLALPQLPPEQRAAITAGMFRSIGRVLVTLAKLPSIRRENLDEWIRFEGCEHVESARRAGRGILFATAHLGNWELSAYAYGLAVGPMNVVVRPLDNPLLDRLVERRRALCGNRILSKRDPARTIMKALAANEAVGILIDQNTSLDSGVFVDFFGIPAAAPGGFVRLAARSGAAVIPGFALWRPEERRYVLRFYPPVPMTGDTVRDTQAVQSVVETVIRARPDQWLWIHRRWKTRPPGAPSLYEPERAASEAV